MMQTQGACQRKAQRHAQQGTVPTEHCHTNRVNLAFGKPPADTVCTGQYGARRGGDIDRLRRGAVLSNTQPYHQSPRTRPRPKSPYGPVRCAARWGYRYRTVLSTTLTYYQSLRTPPTTKRSVRASTARSEAGISVLHGNAIEQTVLNSTGQ